MLVPLLNIPLIFWFAFSDWPVLNRLANNPSLPTE
jgi:hypothetical protein